jgi:hypothetical protein
MVSEVKKRKRKTPLRSKEERAKIKYTRELNQVYLGYMKLPADTFYVDATTPIDHQCGICGGIVAVTPKTILTGRGCTICKTTADHIHDLSFFKEELAKVHENKFSLAYDPIKFKRDSGKYREMFKCRDCGSQHYQRPLAMLEKSFTCSVCTKLYARGKGTKFYRERLFALYGNRIELLGYHHSKNELPHECDKYHTWMATSAEMLQGAGCPHCKNSVEVKQIRPIKYRNQTFVLRTKLEAKALKAMYRKIGYSSQIRSSLTYPIPVLYGKNPPALLHFKTKLMVDVVKRERFHLNARRFIKSVERAKALGYSYGVIAVGKDTATGIWDEDLLTGKTKLSKKKSPSLKEILNAVENTESTVLTNSDTDLPWDE